jgi:hypothetical protein
MRRLVSRLAGALLIIAGIIGLGLSLAGLIVGLPALGAAEQTLDRRVDRSRSGIERCGRRAAHR